MFKKHFQFYVMSLFLKQKIFHVPLLKSLKNKNALVWEITFFYSSHVAPIHRVQF